MDTAIGAHEHAAAHQAEADRRLRIGILLYVITDIIFVAILFASYVFLRGYDTQGGFLPKGVKVAPAQTPTILMILLIISAISYFVAYRSLQRDNQTLYRAGVAAAVVLMLITMVGQIRYMGQLPFTATDGSYASAYIMLNGYHAFHLIIATLIGLGLLNRALRGRYSSVNTTGVMTIGYFWYWACALGLALWLLFLILPA